MPIVNPKIEVREGGFIEALRYALDNKTCLVMALVEVTADKSVNASSEALLDAAFKELDMDKEEFNTKVVENQVRMNVGGYFPMPTIEYLDHINEFTAAHEAPGVVFVSNPEKVKALQPKVTLQ